MLPGVIYFILDDRFWVKRIGIVLLDCKGHWCSSGSGQSLRKRKRFLKALKQEYPDNLTVHELFRLRW